MTDSHLFTFYISSPGSTSLSRNESISSNLSNTSTQSCSAHPLVILLISVEPTPPLSFLLCVIRIFPWSVWLKVYQFYWLPPRASFGLYYFSMIFPLFSQHRFSLRSLLFPSFPVLWVSFTFLILVSWDWIWDHWSETSLLFYYTPLMLLTRTRALKGWPLSTFDTFFLTLSPWLLIPLLISPVTCGLLKNMLFCFWLISDFPDSVPWLISASIPLCSETTLSTVDRLRRSPETGCGHGPSVETGCALGSLVWEPLYKTSSAAQPQSHSQEDPSLFLLTSHRALTQGSEEEQVASTPVARETTPADISFVPGLPWSPRSLGMASVSGKLSS